MKLCKNCHTIHEEKIMECTHCNMNGQLILYYPGRTKVNEKVKNLYQTCRNCGTADPGNGQSCVHCHFPLSQTGDKKSTATTETKIHKHQQNFK